MLLSRRTEPQNWREVKNDLETEFLNENQTERAAEILKNGGIVAIPTETVYGLAASADVTLPLLAHLADVFYIGGTKCGALCGEAVVFPKGDAPAHMLSHIKQHGALLAKSRVVGVQFEALFRPNGGTNLYMDIGKHSVALAMRLRNLFVNHLGYRPFIDSPTNQQFYIIPNEDLAGLREHVGFEVWCPVDEQHTACRFVTSWATTEEEIDSLARVLPK